MYSFKLISHPDSLLINHLRNVGNRAESIVKSKELKFAFSKENLAHCARIMGYTHDLGKATVFFQKYLKEMIQYSKSDVDKTLRSHGYLSALCTYLELKDFNEKLAMMGFIIVRKHHGDIDNADLEYSFSQQTIKNDNKIFLKQLEGLNEEEFENILLELKLKNIEKDDILSCLEYIEEAADDLMDEISTNSNCEEFILYKFLYSTLIFSDKEDAIFHSQNSIHYDIPYNVIDEYKGVKFSGNTSSLGNVRNSIYEAVVKSVMESTDRIMSITVPTGTGKTLTAMTAALYLKYKLEKDMRIIYCLPFTSVIDQNYEVYNGIIETVMGKDKATNDRILKHHHLSEPVFNSEYKNYEDNQSKFLIENWNSQIVVTTFMQFFNCLFSNRNNQVVKYNSIANSIVLLDEIQSVPYRYWLVINRFFKEIADKLNVYFILITATQPLIFNHGEIRELVEENEQYFRAFKRTKLNINLEPVTKEEFVVWLEELILENEEKNILIIVNTIKLAQDIYNFIKDMDIENSDCYFLTTGVIPKERKKRINLIKSSNKRKIVVSTQLIEAGVDIDMDIVVRDLATLDSINQSAGRCNREYRGDYFGEVYLCNIVNDKGKPYSNFIYDKYLINKTKEVLKDKTLIYEEDFLELNNEYFRAVSEDMSHDESRKLLKYINMLKFKDINDNFKLIEDQDKISVFVEVDEDAKKIWKEFIEIREESNPLLKRERFDKIKKEFYENVISVYRNKVKDAEQDGIVYIPFEALASTYDIETGYMLNDMDVII